MYATGNNSQAAVFLSTTVTSTGFMASVTAVPIGGVVGLVVILLDQNELDADIRCLGQDPQVAGVRREDVSWRLLLVRSGYPAADGYRLN